MNIADYPEAFAALGLTSVRMAEIVKITRDDGVIYRFTGYSEDITLTEADTFSYVYKRANSFGITALDLSAGMAVSNMDINAIIDDDSITSGDLISGKFDNAKVEFSIVAWDEAGATWTLPLRVSWMGHIEHRGIQFKSDLRGIAQRLASIFTDTASLECRYNFGDANCTVDLAPYTQANSVASVNADYSVVTLVTSTAGRSFRHGRLVMTSGQADGLDIEIIKHTGDTVTLFLPAARLIAPGDTCNVIEGCRKVIDACDEYGNTVNMGAEPFMRGKDIYGRYPDAK